MTSLRDQPCITGIGETAHCRAPGSGVSELASMLQASMAAIADAGLRPHDDAGRRCAGELRAGLPVEVVFDDVTDEVTLPRFRRRGGAR